MDAIDKVPTALDNHPCFYAFWLYIMHRDTEGTLSNQRTNKSSS
jgi:hypothetical protein